ncbi:tetratricopeptide repeat protein [Sphingomonas sp. MMS12-HWE2-04]|uniref:tetratricopeptide repeat protein n=1 Tax=Sphingomonas sp. MMS12-HWE2-04 TaxID=3234199 RepID=UPI00385122D4
MNFALALLLAAAPLATAAAQTADPGEDARNAKLAEAVTAIQSKEPQKALAVLDPLLADYASLYAGEKRTMLCDTARAETAAYAQLPGGSAARLVDSGWCIALWAKGFALIDVDKLDEAVPYLERAAALSPLHAHYLSELGYAYQSQKKWQVSYDTYAKAADAAKRQDLEQRKKSLRRAWFGMAYNLVELGRYDEAEALFNKCLELVPGDEAVLAELAYLKEQRAKPRS